MVVVLLVLVVLLVVLVLQLVVVLFACRSAFEIRTFAIKEYGRLIHECVRLPRHCSQNGAPAGGRDHTGLGPLRRSPVGPCAHPAPPALPLLPQV